MSMLHNVIFREVSEKGHEMPQK